MPLEDLQCLVHQVAHVVALPLVVFDAVAEVPVPVLEEVQDGEDLPVVGHQGLAPPSRYTARGSAAGAASRIPPPRSGSGEKERLKFHISSTHIPQNLILARLFIDIYSFNFFNIQYGHKLRCIALRIIGIILNISSV